MIFVCSEPILFLYYVAIILFSMTKIEGENRIKVRVMTKQKSVEGILSKIKQTKMQKQSICKVKIIQDIIRKNTFQDECVKSISQYV